MYRNAVYNSRNQSIKLFTWDDEGRRVTRDVTFNPYLYLESPDGDKVSIYGTKVKKRSFNTQYDRTKYIADSGNRRLFENIPTVQQYLLETFWRENETPEFTQHPLKVVFFDIETFSPSSFPNTEDPTHPVNVITCYDTTTKKFNTFGLAPYTNTADNVVYYHCKNERDLFIKFIEYIESDYPDILSGWNCIEENQHVWLQDRIVKIKDLSNNFENKPLKRHGICINNFMNTGIKSEYEIKTEHGSSVLCSKDHRFMVYRRKKTDYKNFKTLTKNIVELSVADIERDQVVYDFYAVKHLGINNNSDLNYQEFVESVPALRDVIVDEDQDSYIFNFTTTRRVCDNFIIRKKESISLEILQLMGFIFTDGTYDKSKQCYRLTSKYSDLIASYTAAFAKEHNKNLKPFTECITRFNNREFISYTKQICNNNKARVLHNLIYNKSDSKQPDVELLSRLSYSQFKAFFSGMIDGDGWIEQNGISLCNYDCTKYKFLNDLQELLLWNGVQSRLHKNYITVNSNNINQKFLENLYIRHTHRKTKLSNLKYRTIKNTASNKIQWMYGGADEYVVRILPITKTGREVQMYDITTETHTFLCNGIHTHNCEGFDIPYIINRIERLLGQEYVNRLSPVGQVYDRTMRGKFGREVKRYYISGVACIDYLDIYKRFCLRLRESYKLDAIGEVELNERKVDYGDINLATLSETDWDTFVKYNIQDVNLLVKLEEKLQYVSLLRMLSYVGLTTLEGAMGTISVINGALTIKARKRKEVISTFVRPQAEGKNPGAYVAEPKHGFKENVVSFDANSLYPNVMIALNLSPETKVGKIEKTDDNNFIVHHISGKSFNLTKEKFSSFIKQEELAITKAGFLFTQKKQGIIPEFLDHYYKERVIIKEELFKVRKKLQTLNKSDADYEKIQFEVERLNTKQMVIKILVNSCYGYMGNKQAPIGDDDIASSVTLTGQAVIKQAGKLLQNYLTTNFNVTDSHTLNESWVYSDTDSCYFSLGCIKDKVPLKDGEVISEKFYKTVNDLEDYLNIGITLWAKKNLLTKDSRFVFKRECIADVAVFLQKKRYVMHILDDEGLKVDKFKYVGVEVVRTTMPNAIKPYAKKIIETMLLTQSQNQTNKLLNETFDVFKSLSPEEIAFVMGVKGYEKYASQCKEFLVAKGMPIHVKSAYYHNLIMSKIDGKSETITSGDKIRYLYVEKQNKYGITTIGFKYDYNAEFRNLFKIDYVLMFEKILFNSIERFYDSVNWRIRKPTDNVQTELDDLFGF